MRKRYEVQTCFTYGWENCWTENDEIPLTFPNMAEAEVELNDFLHSAEEAGMLYYREHYRIVEYVR